VCFSCFYSLTVYFVDFDRQEKDEVERVLSEVQQRYQTASTAFAQAKKDLEALKKKADAEAPIKDDDGNELPLKDQLEDLPVDSTTECELALDEAVQKANSIVADSNVIRVYEERKREMEEVQAELDNLTSSEEQRKNALQQKLIPWEEALSNAVAKIDALFGKYMNEMGCTGTNGSMAEHFTHHVGFSKYCSLLL
jgi:chromosome segregation ATPase